MSNHQHNKNKYLTKREDRRLRLLQGHHRWIHLGTDFCPTDFLQRLNSPVHVLLLTLVTNTALQPKVCDVVTNLPGSSSGWRTQWPSSEEFRSPVLQTQYFPPAQTLKSLKGTQFTYLSKWLCDLILPQLHQIGWSLWEHIVNNILNFLPQPTSQVLLTTWKFHAVPTHFLLGMSRNSHAFVKWAYLLLFCHSPTKTKIYPDCAGSCLWKFCSTKSPGLQTPQVAFGKICI